MKALFLRLADVAAAIWGVLPARLRRALALGLFVLEGRAGDPRTGLRNLFAIEDALDLAINERATALGRGEHPKHRLTRYHDFFVERIPDGSCVLDVGCGYGAVARSIARARPSATVLGVELDKSRLSAAQAADNPPNLSFARADATVSLPAGPWNVVVLSNVLEHIENRVGFLKALVATARPATILVRVPLFERDWKLAMRREVGANWMSDPEHFIEHTRAEFAAEMASAGLSVVERVTLWGEIWAQCRPDAGADDA
ncbi:MAG: class I SAM-dependent methyltransferase [Rhodospirillales bacterium]|nr:class I SAM-dependent methyltransferase [Rhodospirillales bacterium]